MPTWVEPPLEVQQAAQDAEGWMRDYAWKHNLDLDKLTLGEKFRLSMMVPCVLRCWQAGVAISLQPGERCDECGKLYDPETFWKKLVREDEF